MDEKDIVDILKEAGWGVVEGKEAVLRKIKELAVYPSQNTARKLLEGRTGVLEAPGL